MAGQIDVDPAGLAVSVSFTTMAGAAVTPYSDAGLSVPLASTGVAVANRTAFYLAGEGPYLVSVLLGGVELGPFIAKAHPGVVTVVQPMHKLDEAKQDAVLSAALAAGGGLTAGPVQLTSTFDVQSVGTTDTDLPAQSLAVPASVRGQMLTAKYEVRSISGTAAIASNLSVVGIIADASNNILALDEVTFVQVTAVTVTFRGKLVLELYLPGPVAAATYKVRAKLVAAAPANWTSTSIIPGFGAAIGGANNFYSRAC